MGKDRNISNERLKKMNDVLLNMCLHFCGAQYTESILRGRGFKDNELEAVGFEIDEEWAYMERCMEV